jgi:hypothetical protein
MPEIQPATLIQCTCGNRLGEEIQINDVALIHAGGGIWHELSGHCAQCNAPFYWSTKATLIRRAISSSKKISTHDREDG